MSVEIFVPELGESVLEATVVNWLKKEGDQVKVGEALVELETDKVNLEVGAERAGVLQKIKRKAGEDVKVGDVLGILEASVAAPPEEVTESEPEGDEAEPQKEAQISAQPNEPASPKSTDPPAIQATPVAQRLAREQQVDLSAIRGRGPGGRVTKDDVRQHLEKSADSSPSASPSAPQKGPVSQKTESRPEERLKMSRRRRTIARRLVAAQQNAALLSTFNEVDMRAVMDLRKRRNPAFQEQHGIKLGIASFFVKAAVGALKAFPRLNAEIDGDEIVIKHYYDIGVAIGDEEGLVVPVLRDVERLSFAEIERQIRDFVAAVREKRVALEDLRGGTFSITNGGIFGSLLSTPILNPPQVGILGLHKIEARPVAIDGELEIRPMMYVALSYDHRIVDGREAVQFLVRIKELVEDPERLLLEG